MPMIHVCARPGCETLTMGAVCLEHEQQDTMRLRMRVQRTLPRFAARARWSQPRQQAHSSGRVFRASPPPLLDVAEGKREWTRTEA